MRRAIRAASTLLAGVLALALGGPARAHAESFVALAATGDGGAWLTVDTTGANQIGPGSAEPGPRRVELRRVARDGAISVERVPRDEPVEAIATGADDALWALTAAAVLRRDRAGTWHALDIPRAAARTGESLQAAFAIAPLTADRALIARGCPGRAGPHGYPLPCSELFVVDLARMAAEPPLQVEASTAAAVGDRGGGAWLLLARDAGYGAPPHGEYARFDGTDWTAWTHDGEPLPGMRAGGKLAVVSFVHADKRYDIAVDPDAIAASPDGLLGATGHSVIAVGSDGAASGSNVDFASPWQTSLALVARDDTRALVVSPHSTCGLCIHEHDDCSPAIVALSPRLEATGFERVPTPAWWQRAQVSCPARLRADAAGGQLWLVTGDAVFHRDRAGWHTIEAAGARGDLQPVVRFAASVPLELGGGVRSTGGGGVAFGLRPELVISRDVAHPGFGAGPYLELATLGGDGGATYLGGGLTAVAYGQRVAGAVSVGLDAVDAGGAWQGQLVASGFLGFRHYFDEDLPLDGPFGLRVDVRPRTGALPTTVTAWLTLDAATLGIAAATLGGIGRHD